MTTADQVATLKRHCSDVSMKAANHHRMIFARNASTLFDKHRSPGQAKTDHYKRMVVNVDHMTAELSFGFPVGKHWDNRRKVHG
jgi:hypothetical protein